MIGHIRFARRRRVLRRAALALGVVAALGVARGAPASAQSESVDSVGDWNVLFTEVSSGLKICSTARLDNAGAWLLYDRSSDGADLLTVYAPNAPVMPKDQGVAPIEITVFSGAQERTITVADPGYPVELSGLEGVMISLDDDAVRALRTATALSVSYAGYSSDRVSLEDFGRALTAIDACSEDRF